MPTRDRIVLACLNEFDCGLVRAELAEAGAADLAALAPPGHDVGERSVLARAFKLVQPDVLVYVSSLALARRTITQTERLRDLHAGIGACSVALEHGVTRLVLVVGSQGEEAPGASPCGARLEELARGAAVESGAALSVVEVSDGSDGDAAAFGEVLAAAVRSEGSAGAVRAALRPGTSGGSADAIRARASDIMPPAVEEVVDRGEGLLALIVRGWYGEPGIRFLSAPDSPQQIGVINYPVGHVIPAHVHTPIVRTVSRTQETLFVRSGAVRLDVYDEERRHMRSIVLVGGDVVHLVAGGHGLEILEPATMVEVKQGPYLGEQEKVRFEAVSDDTGQ
ncbi:MAG: hypothetical protein N3B11_00010 [Coriobacteriia bacterium]|nr:hypothetical protein [Coriobacteriia bacterium]